MKPDRLFVARICADWLSAHHKYDHTGREAIFTQSSSQDENNLSNDNILHIKRQKLYLQTGIFKLD